MITHQLASPCNPERVVLLGGRGFIGRAIQASLLSESIAALVISSSDLDLASASSIPKLNDLLQPTDAVVMLSAVTPDKGRDVATMMTNLVMMQNLCAVLGQTGCAHLAYFSSDAVYDSGIARVTEATPASPLDLYGAMHRTREIMAAALRIPLLVLRPTLVYGADDTHNAYGPNRFRRMAELEGKIVLFGAGEELRDHIHVDDVAWLTLRCLRHRSVGLLNVATGVSTSFRQVAMMIAAQFGDPVAVFDTPRANPVTHRHYDVTNLIKAFPDFRFLALQDGIRRCRAETPGAA